jgi:hypothetical protein
LCFKRGEINEDEKILDVPETADFGMLDDILKFFKLEESWVSSPVAVVNPGHVENELEADQNV